MRYFPRTARERETTCLSETKRHLRRSLHFCCLHSFRTFYDPVYSCLLILFPLLPPALSLKWLIVNSFLEGCCRVRVGGGETTCFCYLNTRWHAVETTIKHPAPYLTSAAGVDVEGCWQRAASWAWQLYEPTGTIKTKAGLLPGFRLEKHEGTGDRMPVWPEFTLVSAASSHRELQMSLTEDTAQTQSSWMDRI